MQIGEPVANTDSNACESSLKELFRQFAISLAKVTMGAEQR